MMVQKMAESRLDGHQLGKSDSVVLSTDVAGVEMVESIAVQMAVVERMTMMMMLRTEVDP